MRECLGEVAEEPMVLGVVLLGEQPEVVAQGEQLIEQLARLGAASERAERVDKPKRAGEEGALAAAHAIDVSLRLGRVAQDQAVADRQLLADGVDVPATRGSPAGRKPTRGMRSRLASSWRAS
jgi:hypothetical protein